MDSEISSKYNSKSEKLEGIADMEFFDFGVYEKLIKKDESVVEVEVLIRSTLSQDAIQKTMVIRQKHFGSEEVEE